ncbi:MAG TPA: YggS family pyridoxal phosphate-dependent enzyme [Gemmatimonadales bacterium]
MIVASLPENLARVRARIGSVQVAEGISGDVRIVAVTKGHAVAAVEAARAAGVMDVGENRVQEALAKQDEAPPDLRWHLIGHVQTNKARLVPGRFAMVHSVDSVRLAAALDRAAQGSRLPVLLQVNVAGEAQKSGCPPEIADEVLAHIGTMSSLAVTGLMTMAPFTADERLQRQVFGSLRRLRDRLATTDRPLRELSMGMSDDFPAAVAEGATILRLGTVLFGARGG